MIWLLQPNPIPNGLAREDSSMYTRNESDFHCLPHYGPTRNHSDKGESKPVVGYFAMLLTKNYRSSVALGSLWPLEFG